MAWLTGLLLKEWHWSKGLGYARNQMKWLPFLFSSNSEYVWHLRFQIMFSLAFINQSDIKLSDCSPGYYLILAVTNFQECWLSSCPTLTFDSGILSILNFDKSCCLIICTSVMKWGYNNSIPVKRIPSKSPSLVNFEVKLSRNWDSWNNKRTKMMLPKMNKRREIIGEDYVEQIKLINSGCKQQLTYLAIRKIFTGKSNSIFYFHSFLCLKERHSYDLVTYRVYDKSTCFTRMMGAKLRWYFSLENTSLHQFPVFPRMFLHSNKLFSIPWVCKYAVELSHGNNILLL